jgi:Predicted aspartyl protease
MGHIYAKALFRGSKGVHEEQSMLVDTGATYTFLPLSVIEKIGAVRTPWKIKIRLGDGRIMEGEIALGLIELEEREAPVKIVIADGAMEVIGVETLEALGLKANPITGKLEPTREPGALLVSLRKMATLEEKTEILERGEIND